MANCGVELEDAEFLASHMTAMANTGGGTIYIGNSFGPGRSDDIASYAPFLYSIK